MKNYEIRQNKATRQWVVFSRARRKRPSDFGSRDQEKRRLPGHDDRCPFCSGNESSLPPIIYEKQDGRTEAWLTRVVPNKYPALSPESSTKRRKDGIYTAMGGYGAHEVVIEGPVHNRQMAEMSLNEGRAIIETYHRRYVQLMREHENMMTIIFHNHGVLAGTSLLHPHSQIIVTGLVPQHIRLREEEAQRYYDQWGRCVYCDILEFELQDRKRLISENGSFAAFIPYAADVPFEIWIVPKKHEADFGSIADSEEKPLAALLRDCLRRLRKGLNDPDYNYVINTAARFRSGEPQLHWYLQIRPRLTTQAGFEIGSGMNINPSIPEEDAAFLRDN